MKVLNYFGIEMEVPDDWTEETLREKNLIVIQEKSPAVKTVSPERAGGGKKASANSDGNTGKRKAKGGQPL